MRSEVKGKTEIVLIGAGPLGLNVAGIVQRLPQYQLLGFIDTIDSPIGGIDVIGDDSMLDSLFTTGVRHLVVCIGNAARRLALGEELRHRAFELPTIIHPAADLGLAVTIGRGTIVFPGAHILPRAEIGDYCVIEAGCFVGHHTRVGRGSLLGARAMVGNRVTLDEGVTMGMGATVKTGSHVPAGSRIADLGAWT
jgi:UDP-perosamine 4-acetyltransferase